VSRSISSVISPRVHGRDSGQWNCLRIISRVGTHVEEPVDGASGVVLLKMHVDDVFVVFHDPFALPQCEECFARGGWPYQGVPFAGVEESDIIQAWRPEGGCGCDVGAV
jgi:hypothetical protein